MILTAVKSFGVALLTASIATYTLLILRIGYDHLLFAESIGVALLPAAIAWALNLVSLQKRPDILFRMSMWSIFATGLFFFGAHIRDEKFVAFLALSYSLASFGLLKIFGVNLAKTNKS